MTKTILTLITASCTGLAALFLILRGIYNKETGKYDRNPFDFYPSESPGFCAGLILGFISIFTFFNLYLKYYDSLP